MASRHFIADLKLAFRCDIDFCKLDNSRGKFIAGNRFVSLAPRFFFDVQNPHVIVSMNLLDESVLACAFDPWLGKIQFLKIFELFKCFSLENRAASDSDGSRPSCESLPNLRLQELPKVYR